MSEWSLASGARYKTYGQQAGGSNGTQILYTTANTKNSWTEITSSTDFDASAIWITVYGETSGVDMLVDIGIGAASSEQVLIPDLLLPSRDATGPQPTLVRIPVRIPSGSRLSVRFQNSVGTCVFRITLMIEQSIGLWHPALSRVTAYGVNTADSGAVGVDPGGTINTKGSYSEIVSSITNPAKLLYVALGVQANTTRTDCTWLMDVAIGGSGSEQIIIPDLWFGCTTAKDIMVPQFFGPFAVNLPSGTRIAARSQCSINDAADRLYDVAVYGVD